MTLVLICVVLPVASSEDAPAPSADLSRPYQEARARAGRSSGEQVRLAPRCEARLTRERLNHLAQAVMSADATARGLMGLVA
jgi:hypothetical protein